MKTCPQCGAEVTDTAKFCRSCGTPLTPVADVQPEATQEPSASSVSDTQEAGEQSAAQAESAVAPTETSFPAAEASNAEAAVTEGADAETQSAQIPPVEASTAAAAPSAVSAATAVGDYANKALDYVKAHKKPFAIGAAVVAAIIIVVIAVSVLSKPVSADQLKTDLMQTSFVTNGAVSDNYVNESAYEITDLSISDEQTGSQTVLGTSYDMATVTFSGTMKNDNFETQFTGVGYYYKTGNTYQCMSCEPSATETKPLKGVDTMSASTSDSVTVSDFTSDFSESNGTYTSTASQKSTYDFWFATDTCTNTQTFTFSPTSGWKTTGDASVADQQTDWKLAGKSFALANESTSSSWSRTSTMTFKDCSSNGATADYSFSASYTSANQYNEDYYKDVALSGGLTGTVTHDFGTETFKIELNDSENSVTFQLSNNNSTIQAGTGTVNSMRATLDTQVVYFENDFWGSSVYENVSLVYAEQTTA